MPSVGASLYAGSTDNSCDAKQNNATDGPRREPPESVNSDDARLARTLRTRVRERPSAKEMRATTSVNVPPRSMKKEKLRPGAGAPSEWEAMSGSGSGFRNGDLP